MKALKIVLLTLLSLFVAIYLAFLFVLPYSVDLNKYGPQITQAIQDSTGFQVKVRGLRVKTAWNLSGGALIDKTEIYYPKTVSGGEKFAQIKGLNVKLSLIPLFFGQIKVDSVNADDVILKLKVEKSGKFLLEKAIPKSGQTPSVEQAQMPFKFSESMPNVHIKKYKIAFIDVLTAAPYTVKGRDLAVSGFVLNQKIKVKTSGELVLKGRKQISYNVFVFSKVLPPAETGAPQAQPFKIISVFEDLYKYNACANINAKLKITGIVEEPAVSGDVNLDNVTFVLKGQKLPSSNLKLQFNEDKIKIKSDFYTDTDEKALITGVFDNGRKKAINLKVVSDKTDIGNTFLIANTLLGLIGRNDLKDISASGHLNANFVIKSDFKKIQSSGFLNIKDAKLVHRLYNVSLNKIFADIDFSENEIDIKKSTASLDGKPISIKGSIDKNANADISIEADKLSLKGLLTTLGQTKLLKENDILGGLISIKAVIKGRLDKVVPTVDIVVSGVDLRNRPNKLRVNFSNAKIVAKSNGKKTDGKLQVVGVKVFPQGSSSFKVVSVPNLSIGFNEKDLKIDDASLFLNNSKIIVFGKITDYQTDKINTDITARGLIFAKDIKSMLPPANQSGVEAVGKIPLLVRVTGKNKQEIHAQMLANSTNHLSLFDINMLKGKTSLINADLTLAGDELKIHEINLYSLGKNKGLSSNMKANLSSANNVARVEGQISNINKTPWINNINVSIPNQLTSSIPGFAGSVVKVKGDVKLSGSVNNPEIKGALALPFVSIPTIRMNIKNADLNFNKNYINVSCPQLSVAKSPMVVNAVVFNNFSNGIVVKNVNFSSAYIDLDSLGAAFANLPQNANAPGVDSGITVLGGRAKIDKFKTGGIIATNINSGITLKRNVLKLDNIKGEAFLGQIGGEVSYNLVYGKTKMDIQGRGLSAGPAIKGLTGMPDSIVGKLDFDSNISMTGATQRQILSSLRGDTKFIISNGKMGQLGKLEHLLYAQNVLSNNVFRTSLNVIAKALALKNTGLYKYIKGDMTFANGWANIAWIKTSGPSMSMYITGRYSLLSNTANIIVLGRLSDDVVRILGPLGDLSMDKVLSYIPKIGTITAALINQMTTNPDSEDTSLIPYLTPRTELPTKDFKVVIDGDINRQTSVKSFKWLSTPHAAASSTSSATRLNINPSNISKTVQDRVQTVKQQVQGGAIKENVVKGAAGLLQEYTGVKSVPDFINSLPDLK